MSPRITGAGRRIPRPALCSSALCAVVFSLVTCIGAEPPGYYNSAQNKTGAELRHALHVIIRGHIVVPYSLTDDALKALDEDPANTNNVRLLYAQRSDPKSNFGGLSTNWNREHIWPNSYGLDDQPPAFSDLFNLRPEDLNVNNERGNKYFAVSDTNSASYRFPAHPEALQCSTDVDSWEAPPAVRGDIARSLFYMDVRYEGDVAGEPDLVLSDNTALISTAGTIMSRLTTLLFWHRLDPVDDAERLRNDRIYTNYQQNRNPFIDHPEWVEAVFAPALSATRLGQDLILQWNWDHTNFVLEHSELPGAMWLRVPGSAVNSDGTWSLTQPTTGGTRIFRLKIE